MLNAGWFKVMTTAVEARNPEMWGPGSGYSGASLICIAHPSMGLLWPFFSFDSIIYTSL